MAGRVYPAFLHCLKHRATLFHRMGTAGEPAIPGKFGKFGETLRQLLLQDDLIPLQLDCRKAGRVRNITILADPEQLDMPGGMPPPPELLAGLAGREGQPGIEPVEQAGLPNPGIPGKGTDPMGKRFPQAVQPLFALDRKSVV